MINQSNVVNVWMLHLVRIPIGIFMIIIMWDMIKCINLKLSVIGGKVNNLFEWINHVAEWNAQLTRHILWNLIPSIHISIFNELTFWIRRLCSYEVIPSKNVFIPPKWGIWLWNLWREKGIFPSNQTTWQLVERLYSTRAFEC